MRFKLVNKNRFLACLVVILITTIVISINIKTNGKNETESEIKDEVRTEVVEEDRKEEVIQPIVYTYYQPIVEPIKESKVYYDIPLSDELQDYTREMCKKYDVDFGFILSMMHTESEFNHKNSTPNDSEIGNSEGLLQINTGSQKYIKWYSELTGIKDLNLKDEKQNIEVGIAVFKFYKDYWEQKGYTGNELLIRSFNTYNCGIGGYKQYIKNTGKISRSYDRKVFKYKEKLEDIKVLK